MIDSALFTFSKLTQNRVPWVLMGPDEDGEIIDDWVMVPVWSRGVILIVHRA